MKKLMGFAITSLYLLTSLVHAESQQFYDRWNELAMTIETIKHLYVEETDREQLVENAIEGMLNALDPYSTYLNEKEAEDFMADAVGVFGGLGIIVTMEDKMVKVIAPIDGTPAFKIGIKAGDYITKIDLEDVHTKSLDECVALMRGEPGSSVKLSFFRKDNNDVFEHSITREIIEIPNVSHEIKNNTAYIRIAMFNDQTTDQLNETFKEIEHYQFETDELINGYILDLRSNPGGLLTQAVSVCDLFVDKSLIVYSKDRQGKRFDEYYSNDGVVIDLKQPLVVLINKGTASAAEIVSGTLAHYNRAVTIGETTFGKGSVQSVVPVSNDTYVKLTTAMYYLPHDISIHKIGVEPSIKVEFDHETDVDEQREYAEAYLNNASAAKQA
jgi:carboxyl-terminal processing protease